MKTLHTPGGHNLDVMHLGVCMNCGGTKIVDADSEPFDKTVYDEMLEALLSAKQTIDFLVEAGSTNESTTKKLIDEAIAKATGESLTNQNQKS